mmetsp:Transcript_22482/g.53949  ORF Transcript_22482/g.53949 Transcript_22482/m.53949 type:complete len:411 (+) Transcript_22482:19-1251(+)
MSRGGPVRPVRTRDGPASEGSSSYVWRAPRMQQASMSVESQSSLGRVELGGAGGLLLDSSAQLVHPRLREHPAGPVGELAGRGGARATVCQREHHLALGAAGLEDCEAARHPVRRQLQHFADGGVEVGELGDEASKVSPALLCQHQLHQPRLGGGEEADPGERGPVERHHLAGLRQHLRRVRVVALGLAEAGGAVVDQVELALLHQLGVGILVRVVDAPRGSLFDDEGDVLLGADTDHLTRAQPRRQLHPRHAATARGADDKDGVALLESSGRQQRLVPGEVRDRHGCRLLERHLRGLPRDLACVGERELGEGAVALRRETEHLVALREAEHLRAARFHHARHVLPRHPPAERPIFVVDLIICSRAHADENLPLGGSRHGHRALHHHVAEAVANRSTHGFDSLRVGHFDQ